MTADSILKRTHDLRTEFERVSSREELYQLTIEGAETLFSIDAGELLIEQNEELISQTVSDTEPRNLENSPTIAPTIAEQTYQSHHPILIRDAAREDQIATDTEYRSILGIPLGEHGVLQLAAFEPDHFDECTLALADVFGGLVVQKLNELPSDSHPIPSTDRTHKFLEIADVMMIVLDDEGQITFANRKARDILEYEEEELVGRNWFETCVPEQNRAEVRDVFERLMAEEIDPVERHENPVITNNGDERIIEWHNAVLRDDDGDPIGTLSSGLDITARKEYEQRLRAERDTYSTLIDQFPNGLVTLFDEEFRYQIVGGTGFDQLEHSPEDLKDQRLEEVFPPENVEALKPLYQRALEGEKNVTEQTLEGRVFRIHIVPVRDSDGEVIAGMTMSQDITEQNELEEELREREIHLQQAQEIADLGSWYSDIQTGEIHWSETCYRIFGLPEDETLTHERFIELVHPEDREYVDRQWDAAMNGEPYDIEHRIRVNGETKWVRETAEIEFDDDGNPIGGIGIVQDITARKEREQTLEAAQKRYQTLLQAAPDPVFVADIDTGEIIEANHAAEDLRNQSLDDVIGLHQSELHPDTEADEYQQLFEDHIEEGGTRRRLADGSQIYAVTAEGERIPVEINVETVELDDRAVIYGIFRDISDQLEYERALTSLNETTRELFQAGTFEYIAQSITETVTEVLELDQAAVYRFDENEGVLQRVTHTLTAEGRELLNDPPVVEPGDSIAWRVFTDEEFAVFDDARTDDDVSTPATPIGSEIIVPLGEEGVLIVADTETDAFDERTVELVQILAATAEEALYRVEREQALKQREQQLEQRTKRLENVESINAQIRDIARVIVNAETQREIEETVCAQLVEVDTFDFAWIGGIDPVNETLSPRARAGDEQGYLEAISLSLTEDQRPEAAVQTAQRHEPVVVSNTATDIAKDPWRSAAIRRDFQSVMSIPLVYQETLHGVLTIYTGSKSSFSGTIKSVLVELGGLIAHAIAANKRKQALLSNQGTELEFRIQDQTCFFVQFAQESQCKLELERIVPQTDESSLVFLNVEGVSPEEFINEANQAPAIKNVRLIETNEDALIQLQFVEPFIASILAEQGLITRHISADSSECVVSVLVPPNLDIRQAADFVTSRYPESELIAKREHTHSFEPREDLSERILEEFTPRQREVAEVAYLSGYFDSPRTTTSEELATELGFSTSAFHHHIREAERKLFEKVFEANETPTVNS